MPPTGTPDLLSRGRQTRITMDYKFIIESPCERDRSAAYPCRCPPLTPTHALHGEYSRELDFAELPKWQRVEFVLRATRTRWEHVTVEESRI